MDGSLHTNLNVESATLMLEDPSTVVGKFEPLSASGPSKKLAEHKAAERFLVREHVWKEAE